MTKPSRKRPAVCGKQPRRPKRLVRWTLGDEEILIEMWLSNLSNDLISEWLGRTPNAIAVKAAKLALPRRDRGADPASAEAADSGYADPPEQARRRRACLPPRPAAALCAKVCGPARRSASSLRCGCVTSPTRRSRNGSIVESFPSR